MDKSGIRSAVQSELNCIRGPLTADADARRGPRHQPVANRQNGITPTAAGRLPVDVGVEPPPHTTQLREHSASPRRTGPPPPASQEQTATYRYEDVSS